MLCIADGPALGDYFAIPRVRGLTVCGRDHLLEVGLLRSEGGGWRPTVWAGPARPAFIGDQVSAYDDGSFAYLARSAARPGRDAIWRREPGRPGYEVAAPATGIAGYRVARRTGHLGYATRTAPHTAARAAGVDAVLIDGDGPAGGLRLVVVTPDGIAVTLPEPPEGRLAGRFDLAADGARVVAERLLTGGHTDLVVAEPTGEGWRWRPLPSDVHASFSEPRLSPDGRLVLCVRAETAGPPPQRQLWLSDLDGRGRPVAAGFDGWPLEAVWAPDGRRVYFTADRAGNRPIYSVTIGGDAIRRLTAVGAYEKLSAVGPAVYALRSAVDAPPGPVRLDPDAPAGRRGPVALAAPSPAPRVPGVLERVSTATDDGHRVHGWLCRPPHGPAPLQVWLHGGPYATWAAWSWRWNPWLAVDRGYAVLMPDPAPSTGYGRAFAARAWRDWSGAPASDVLSLSDAVRRRSDVDGSRVAVLGASFGGYLVNLLVTRTDRFRAAVSHAGMWDLPAFVSGSQVARPFVAELGHPVDGTADMLAHSPRSAVAAIRTPVLISHGDRDAKVPPTEAVAQWSDLRHLGKPVKLLRLPGEGHEITTAGNQQVWWQCVFAFLEHTLDGRPFRVPELLQARTAD